MSTVVIQKREGKKGKSYAIRYTNPLSGRKKHYKTFKKYKEANDAANELRSILDSGKIPKKKEIRLVPMTFVEVANSLQNEWKVRLNQNDLSLKTYEGYCIWLNVLKDIFKNRFLCQIAAEEIKSFRDKKAKDYSSVTANRYLTIIKMVFKHGLELRSVIDNPSASITLLSEKNHERNRFLFPHELDRLIEASQKGRAKFYLPAIINLGAEHGAAKQEILSLKWSDINFDYEGRGLINFFRTKNRRERTEFLMPRTRKSLLDWRDHLKWKRHGEKITKIKSDYVFCRIDGTPLKRFDNAWRKVLKLANINDFHFHDLRHTFCSNLILAGAGLKEVKEMIGHSDISMTDRYSHLSINHKMIMQDLLADHYSDQKPFKSSKPK